MALRAPGSTSPALEIKLRQGYPLAECFICCMDSGGTRTWQGGVGREQRLHETKAVFKIQHFPSSREDTFLPPLHRLFNVSGLPKSKSISKSENSHVFE